MKRIPVDDVAARVGQPGQEAIVALMLDEMHPTPAAGPRPLDRRPPTCHSPDIRGGRTWHHGIPCRSGGAGTAVFGITSSTPRQVTTFGWSSAALEATKEPRS